MPTPAIVQSAVSSPGATSLAFSSNVTSGNLLIAALGLFAGGSLSSVTDTLGNTWNLAAANNNGSDKEWIYWTIAGSSGANTVTAAGTGWGVGGYNSTLLVAEVSGGLTGAIDVAGGGYPLTLAYATDAVFTLAFDHSIAAVASVSSPEVLIVSRASGSSMALCWDLAPASGAFTSSLSISFAANISVAFKAPSAPITEEGMVECSGAIAGVAFLVGGPRGLVRCAGSISPAVAFASHAGGIVLCTGSALGVIVAFSSSQGKTRCSGSIKAGITFYGVCQGMVECSGCSTTPLKGTLTGCLEPSSSPVLPPQGNACY
jgi:hypothetical protein